MNFSDFLSSRLATRTFFFNLHIGRVLFFSHSFSGPTLIHAPRPRPITHSIGIGTSEFGSEHVDVSTQGGPPPLELSSFLQDLLPGAVSSPVARASVSVLAPNFHRYLDTSATPRSPPPAPRFTVCCGTSTRDEVQLVDAPTDVVVVSADKGVQAVVEYCDDGTGHDRLGVTSPVLLPADSVESVADPPEDLSVVGSLGADSSPETVVPESDPVPLVKSPMGARLVDSDDEAIATRLPGYLNSFKTCEVSDQQLFICFLLPFHTFFFCFP